MPKRTCSVPTCGRNVKANGLCQAHYARFRRTGRVGTEPIADPTPKSQEQRFWEKVDRRGPDECWLWTAALTSTGYGALRPEGQRVGPVVKAHRYSAELAGLDIEGRHVLHSCDNPPCVNPAHLRPGTDADNVADMVARGRIPRGAARGTAKLRESDIPRIRDLRTSGLMYREIAAEYGVSTGAIMHACQRRT